MILKLYWIYIMDLFVWPIQEHLSIKARNLCVCVCVCVCLSVCLCMCASNIPVDQDQTDLRFSPWLLRGSRVCNIAFVWTVISLINYFINALPIPLSLSTIFTIVTYTPEPITAELKPTSYLKKQADLNLQRCELDWDFAGSSVLFCASKLTVVD